MKTMKTLLSIGTAFALILTVAPVIAADQDTGMFHALSHVTAEATESLSQMSDEQLSAVEGQFFDICLGCANAATVLQGNLNTQTQLGVLAVQGQLSAQGNAAGVFQSIN